MASAPPPSGGHPERLQLLVRTKRERGVPVLVGGRPRQRHAAGDTGGGSATFRRQEENDVVVLTPLPVRVLPVATGFSSLVQSVRSSLVPFFGTTIAHEPKGRPNGRSNGSASRALSPPRRVRLRDACCCRVRLQLEEIVEDGKVIRHLLLHRERSVFVIVPLGNARTSLLRDEPSLVEIISPPFARHRCGMKRLESTGNGGG